MQVIKLRDEYIKLGQALKAAGFVESGADAKDVIVQGMGEWRGRGTARQEAVCRG